MFMFIFLLSTASQMPLNFGISIWFFFLENQIIFVSGIGHFWEAK